MISNRFHWAVTGIGIAMLLAGPAACGPGAVMIAIEDDDIGGVVTSEQGPEAGVWVIAETQDLPTNYIKIVTTDERLVLSSNDTSTPLAGVVSAQ